MDNKKRYGQYFTTNYKYILQNFVIPDNIKIIIEPFAGNCDLIDFIDDKDKYEIYYYDIEPKKDFIIKQDTILEPPLNIDKSFILTNPPYLARNKSTDKILYDKYKTNDLYKCFIQILINKECLGSILILPLNFICSIRKMI
jgi:site-specific DNA-adenine methylase